MLGPAEIREILEALNQQLGEQDKNALPRSAYILPQFIWGRALLHRDEPEKERPQR